MLNFSRNCRNNRNDRGIWYCLLLVVSVWVFCASLLPLTFVETTGEYVSNLKQGFNFKLDSQIVQHAGAWFLIGTLARLSLGGVGPVPLARHCIPMLAIGCVGLELMQAAVPSRHVSLADLLVDTTASSIGVVFGIWAWQRLTTRTHIHHAGRVAACLLFLGIAVGSAWFTLAGHIRTDFDNWDDTFPLLIGNELTGNRPWRGEVDTLAIYPVCLTPGQVRRLAQMPPDDQNVLCLRQQLGTVALYPFKGSEVAMLYDRADAGEPLNLYIQASSDSERVAHKGIRFVKSGIIRTLSPARRIVHAAQRLNEISVEVICAPADLEQKGPARIVSMSINPLERNFTLGQDESDLIFRLRTPGTGPNGTGRLEPRWSGVFADSTLRHLTVTYKNGQLRMFVDGIEHQPRILLYSAGAQVGIDNPAGDFIAVFLLCFLLAVLGVASWPWRRTARAIAVGLLTGVFPWALVSVVCAVRLNRPVEWGLVGFGILVFGLISMVVPRLLLRSRSRD